jgi:hypothetical protein
MGMDSTCKNRASPVPLGVRSGPLPHPQNVMCAGAGTRRRLESLRRSFTVRGCLATGASSLSLHRARPRRPVAPMRFEPGLVSTDSTTRT